MGEVNVQTGGKGINKFDDYYCIRISGFRYFMLKQGDNCRSK